MKLCGWKTRAMFDPLQHHRRSGSCPGRSEAVRRAA